jgi:LAS superfamily LD-carboxypeptidase LdcB
MQPLHLEQKLLFIGFGIVAVVIIAGGIYFYSRMNSLSSRIDVLSTSISSLAASLSSTTAALQSTIAETNTSLSSALNAQQQNVGAIQQQLGGVQSQVGGLSGTVSTIQKLSQIDPELLKKYSKVYFLNDNYVPAHLSEIPSAYDYSSTKQLLFVTQALPHLLSMIDAASSTGVVIYVDSAYRSFAEQKALNGAYTMTYGAGTANSFSADQGYSEHQLGTAVDLITPGLGGMLDDSFAATAANTWLTANAYKYGFELSYPKGNGYYVYEPWHWRFVGVKLATDLHNDGKNFYDLDQRVIDTYLINIFD